MEKYKKLIIDLCPKGGLIYYDGCNHCKYKKKVFYRPKNRLNVQCLFNKEEWLDGKEARNEIYE